MSGWKTFQLRALVDPVKTWNPLVSKDTEKLIYVDLSAVSQERKKIVGAREIFCVEAPSRARQLVHAEDVLVSTVRPNLNAVATVPLALSGATVSTGFCVLRPKNELLNSRYLFHWVKSPKFISDMTRQASGASYPAVSDRIVLSSNIPIAEPLEQSRIADILDKSEFLRDKRHETIGKLEELAQSIFNDMFGDPVTNPKGFQEVTLGDVIYKATDGPHVSPVYVEQGIPFLSTRHVRKGSVEWEDLKFISSSDAEIHWRKCKPEKGDILYTKGGTTGVAAVVDFDREFAVWVHVALLKVNKLKVNPVWLESMLNSEHCYRQSQKLTRGIVNKDLGLKRMVDISMYLPPLDTQEEFVSRLTALRKLKADFSSQLAEFDALFASLQYRAFRGEL
jgi:type I restriction enzyme S subunit